jgi:rSAM/selenodomain-associated transferase 1
MNTKRARELLVVVAKAPVPGEVKTRLFPHLSPQEAANVYQNFLRDTLLEMGTIPGIDAAVAFTPEEAGGIFTSLAAGLFSLFLQRGKDLGERLCNIFVEKLREGYEAVSIINSDSPDLPKDVVQESFRRLSSNQAEVVFGPCDDGGYYLVGMKKVIPELFIDIPWSTDRVLSLSLERAEKMAIKTDLLPRWNDIDTFEELVAFYQKYKDRPPAGPRAAEKTFSFLSSLDKFKIYSHRPPGGYIESESRKLQNLIALPPEPDALRGKR